MSQNHLNSPNLHSPASLTSTSLNRIPADTQEISPRLSKSPDANQGLLTPLPETSVGLKSSIQPVGSDAHPTWEVKSPGSDILAVKLDNDEERRILNRRGDKEENELVPESLLDIDPFSPAKPSSAESSRIISKTPRGKNDNVVIQVLSLNKVPNGEGVSQSDLDARQQSPSMMKRGVSFAKKLVQFEEEKGGNQEKKAMKQDPAVFSDSINSSYLKSILNSPNSSVLRKKRGINGFEHEMEDNLKEIEDYEEEDEVKHTPSNRRIHFDHVPSHHSIGNEVVTPKAGDSNILVMSSEEVIDTNQAMLSEVRGQESAKRKRGSLTEAEAIGMKTTKRKSKKQTVKRETKTATLLLLLSLFLIVSFGAMTLLATLLTYSYTEYKLSLWVGQFSHGFLLSLLMFIFLKVEIHMARKENNKNERQKYLVGLPDFGEGEESSYNDVGINILGFILAVVSGFVMVAFRDFHPNLFNYSTYFVLIEIVILLINATVFWSIFALKNWIAKAKAKDAKADGLFTVPIYRNFMTDLYSARSMLRDQTTGILAVAAVHTAQKRKQKLKEEGIDKYQPKSSFQVITASKVLGSQLLVMSAYLQFLLVVGFVKLMHSIMKKDQYGAAFPVLIFYPIVMEIFSTISILLNNKLDLKITIYAYYLNISFTTFFYRALLLQIRELRYIWVIIAVKGIYKIVVGGIFGIRISYWKTELLSKFQSKMKRKPREEGILEIISSATSQSTPAKRPSKRIDSFEVERKKEMEKEEALRQRKLNKIVEKFAFKFVFTCINDVFYSCVALGLLKVLPLIDLRHGFAVLSVDTEALFVKGTWLEICVDSFAFVVVVIIWYFGKIYQKISVRKALKQFFKEMWLSYIGISLTLLVSFLIFLHIG